VCRRRSERQTPGDEPPGAAIYGGTNGLWPWSGWSTTWAQEQLLLYVWLDRLGFRRFAMAQRVIFFAADLDLTSREGPR
jgi:hypothetical protein